MGAGARPTPPEIDTKEASCFRRRHTARSGSVSWTPAADAAAAAASALAAAAAPTPGSVYSGASGLSSPTSPGPSASAPAPGFLHSQELLATIKAVRGTLDELRKHTLGDSVARGIHARLSQGVNKVSRLLFAAEYIPVDENTTNATRMRRVVQHVMTSLPSSPRRTTAAAGDMSPVASAAVAATFAPLSADLGADKPGLASFGVYSAMEGALRLLDADRAALYALLPGKDGAAPQLASVCSVGVHGDRQIPSHRGSLSQGMLGHVFQTGIMLNLCDAKKASKQVFDPHVDQGATYVTRTALCVPVYHVFKRPADAGDAEGGREVQDVNPKGLLGVLKIMNKLPQSPTGLGTDDTFTPEDEATALEYARLVASILDMYDVSSYRDLLRHHDTMQKLMHGAARTDTLSHFYAQQMPHLHSRGGKRSQKTPRRGPAASLSACPLTQEQVAPLSPLPPPPAGVERHLHQLLVSTVRPRVDRATVQVFHAGRAPPAPGVDAEQPTRAASLTKIDGRTSLREVALYIERVEECWRLSRDKVIHLEARLERLQKASLAAERRGNTPAAPAASAVHSSLLQGGGESAGRKGLTQISRSHTMTSPSGQAAEPALPQPAAAATPCPQFVCPPVVGTSAAEFGGARRSVHTASARQLKALQVHQYRQLVRALVAAHTAEQKELVARHGRQKSMLDRKFCDVLSETERQLGVEAAAAEGGEGGDSRKQQARSAKTKIHVTPWGSAVAIGSVMNTMCPSLGMWVWGGGAGGGK